MTPLGHAAFSYGVGRGSRRWIPLSLAGVIVGGVLPDVDFVLLWAPQFNAWHRVITHNLLVCLLAALLAAAWAGRRRGQAHALAVGLGMALGGLGHLLTDSILDANPSNGLGVAWLWPWSDRVFGPFNLMDLMVWLPAPSNPAAQATGKAP